MYIIKVEDTVVHESGCPDSEFIALSANLSWEQNRSGTLTFTVPPNNYAYRQGLLRKLKPMIKVFFNDEEIWRGRILDVNRAFNNCVTYKCEGWLSVLCDSIVRPEDNITVSLLGSNIAKEFKRLIENHNKQMDFEKRFTSIQVLGFPSDDEEEVPEPTPAPTPTKTIHELALEVIDGLWGNGDERRDKLTAAGYDYDVVQAEVDRMYRDGEVNDYSNEAEPLLGAEEDSSSSETSEEEEEEEEVDPTGPSAEDVISIATGYLGVVTGDALYKEIINTYNSYTPLPRGFVMSTETGKEDPWCDAFISACFILASGVYLIGGPECYVDSHIALFQNAGIWNEVTSVNEDGETEWYKPSVGDLVTFNWNGDGETDHIGLVVEVTETSIKTIEGNSGTPGAVAYQTYSITDPVIRGYAHPKYGSGLPSSGNGSGSSYSNTLDYIMSNFINNEEIGGTIWVDKQILFYIADGYAEKHLQANQPIELGLNLLDYTNSVDASEIYTCLIPVGKDDLLLTGHRSNGSGGGSAATLHGIDVADQVIDFNAISGVDVIISAVTRRDTIDYQFENVYTGARAKGIKIGVYKYSYAVDGASSRAEAQGVVNILNGRELDFPIFLDLEEDFQTAYPEDKIRSIITQFENVVVGAGYRFGIYCNKNWYENFIPTDCKGKYDFWIASVPYDDDGTIREDLKPNYPECRLVGWQYSFDQALPYVSGADLNLFYWDYTPTNGSTTTVTTEEAEPLLGDEETNPIHEIALQVINGDWGNGDERVEALTNAGYDYAEVQAEVNRILLGEDTGTNTGGSTSSETGSGTTTATQATAISDYIVNEKGVELFGKIFRQMDFPEAEDVNTLRAMAEEKLNKAIIEATTIEVSAFDLSLLDAEYDYIKLGTATRVLSSAHEIDDVFICCNVSMDLCNPANNRYTFGMNQKTLTNRYNRLLNSRTTGDRITNYYIEDNTVSPERIDISYTIVSKRVKFNKIKFYKLGSTVILSFVAVFNKKVGDTSSIMKFSEKFAPDSRISCVANNQSSNKDYVMKVTADGQVVITNNKEIGAGDIVSAYCSWQVEEG